MKFVEFFELAYLQLHHLLMFPQGKVVYANYGRREDLEKLKNQGINLEEKIALIRAGKFSLAEKVPRISLKQP